MKIWNLTGIPIVTSHQQLGNRICELYNASKDLKKIPAARRADSQYQIKIKKYKKSLNQLFNIAACKCHNLCKCCCNANQHIAQNWVEFLPWSAIQKAHEPRRYGCSRDSATAKARAAVYARGCKESESIIIQCSELHPANGMRWHVWFSIIQCQQWWCVWWWLELREAA